MEVFKLVLQVVIYFAIGILSSKITLGVQDQFKEENNDEPIDEQTRLGIAGLITPFWPVFLAILLVYLLLAVVMNIFSRLMKPFI